jgi:hypothetical protein
MIQAAGLGQMNDKIEVPGGSLEVIPEWKDKIRE